MVDWLVSGVVRVGGGGWMIDAIVVGGRPTWCRRTVATRRAGRPGRRVEPHKARLNPARAPTQAGSKPPSRTPVPPFSVRACVHDRRVESSAHAPDVDVRDEAEELRGLLLPHAEQRPDPHALRHRLRLGGSVMSVNHAPRRLPRVPLVSLEGRIQQQRTIGERAAVGYAG